MMSDGFDLARHIHEELRRRRVPLPPGRVRVRLDGSTVTLSGDVEWHYQRQVAFDAAQRLAGDRTVLNRIVIRPAELDVAELASWTAPAAS